MTESAYFATQGQKECYKELDVEEYEILGTLDSTTCERCGSYDGKHFPTKDMQVGVNAPPFHPNCRCTTIPYFDDEFTQNEKRAATDENGNYIEVGNMNYEEWKNKYVVKNNVANGNENGIIDVKRKDLSKYIGKDIIKTDNQSIREWYVANVSDIPNQIDKTKPFEEQVKQAYELRNKYKRMARIAMSDEETAKILEKKRPVKLFDELLQDKMKRKKLSKEEALKDILKTASKTNSNINKEFGL